MAQEFRKWLLVQGAVIAGILLVTTGVLWYVRADIRARTEAIRAAQAARAFQLRAVNILATLRRERDEAKPFIPQLESFMPGRDKLISFPRDLERFSRARSVAFGFGFGAETPATEEAAGTISFTLTASGPLNSVLAFLEDLEKSPFIVRLDGLDLTKGGTEYSFASRGVVFFR
ncbi:MAG: hypothetical protein A3G64_02545 [Candidatus Liptonbacteria bacterium RIFCSPLOWO2_12_FULL_60_15]|uniref:Type 4 fimbrial biogenesis protein PilO n=2 Tax=Candidatus Liptoniibacteriota TaxID=1817909 RepID=A0A1G2CLG8_9BACT|nr:MAG: hypothetical protein A3E09_00875 [Candidatus Liptonbacteria bacterium RIFCSPHIGHO2_12_FULL_60_13]OGZ02199.1 MAG: hypothetical protein A3G64_02545 [Candidatus Liptonbacteria bacterium RIFCSPLOWO2_12_FULL_60_15]